MAYWSRMTRILVSACLLGRPVRYDATSKLSGHDILTRWEEEGRIVPVCPEVAVGLPTPRPPAEIIDASLNPGMFWNGEPDAASGEHSPACDVKVVDNTGADVTDIYVRAAQYTVDLAVRHGCRHAVLTDGSPSCGSTFIYDGTFSGSKMPGMGTTTAALRKAGITVWLEGAIAELDAILCQDEPSR